MVFHVTNVRFQSIWSNYHLWGCPGLWKALARFSLTLPRSFSFLWTTIIRPISPVLFPWSLLAFAANILPYGGMYRATAHCHVWDLSCNPCWPAPSGQTVLVLSHFWKLDRLQTLNLANLHSSIANHASQITNTLVKFMKNTSWLIP